MITSLAASQLVYLLAPLDSTDHHASQDINDEFYRFLWNDKGGKIKRKVMINEPKKGELKRSKKIDLCSFNKSLKRHGLKST